MSYKPEIEVSESGKRNWYPNGLCFATYEEALAAASDTYGRWMLATGYRAVESTDVVNYRWNSENGLENVK